MGSTDILLASLVVVAIIVVIAVVAGGKHTSEKFYTSAALEEPTHSYTPYTGTIPYGPWGTRPWAEAAADPVWR